MLFVKKWGLRIRFGFIFLQNSIIWDSGISKKEQGTINENYF